jgi:hypothetical protein
MEGKNEKNIPSCISKESPDSPESIAALFDLFEGV